MRLADPPVRTGDSSTETFDRNGPRRFPIDSAMDVIAFCLIAFMLILGAAFFYFVCWALLTAVQFVIHGAS